MGLDGGRGIKEIGVDRDGDRMRRRPCRRAPPSTVTVLSSTGQPWGAAGSNKTVVAAEGCSPICWRLRGLFTDLMEQLAELASIDLPRATRLQLFFLLPVGWLFL